MGTSTGLRLLLGTVFYIAICTTKLGAQTITSPGLTNGGFVAVNYRPLFTVVISNPSNFQTSGWRFNGGSQIIFHTMSGGCKTASQLSSLNMTCSGSNVITSTYAPPAISAANMAMEVEVVFTPSLVKPKFTLLTKYCPTNTSMVGPIITANGYTYNTSGQFVCPAGQELFYSNSTPGIANTICQNDATWFGAKGLECWGEPTVQLVGNFTGVAGSSIDINCHLNKSVYPKVEHFNITQNNVVIGSHNNGEVFQIHLTRNLSGATVMCQAVTKYTVYYPDKGWSQPISLNVLFKPYKGTTTTNCIENQQCDIEVVSNPAPGNPFLVAPGVGSFAWTVQNHPYYTFQITKPKGTYMFRVNNSVGEGMFNVTVDAKTSTSSANLPLIIGASVAGVLVIAFVIILIVVVCRRNAGKSEQEERQNPIYGSSPNAVDNGTDYAQVQKKNKKNKKEMTENIAYQPASSPDAIEDAYASVSKNEKEVKMNILYGSSTGAHTSQVEDAYAEVDKGKKKKKDKTKAMKVNVAYVPTPENPDAPEEAYAEVNKDKKKKGKKGEKEMKDNILYGSSQAGGSVEDAYAEVDKKKKKNAGAKQGEGSSGATYSEVSKPKNKKKDKPSSSQTPDDDPYAEVDLHGQDSSNLE